MNNEHQIFDTPMPPDRNFNWLRTQGLEHIKHRAGTQWTHFNETDPGVTILDQLCYALTELGYCNNFSINDILCQKDGTIKFNDQFYLPDQILTCSPVTIDDYRKLILDALPEVKNVYIELDKTAISAADGSATSEAVNGSYRVYLYADSQQLKQQQQIQEDKAEETPEQILRQNVYALLTRQRNLGESFHRPVVLTEKKMTLYGSISLTDKASSDEVQGRIQLAMDNYISPPIRQYGYQDMQALGLGSDEIFNGPRLKNGWIPNSELAFAKVAKVSLRELSGIMVAVEGVKAVTDLKLQLGDAVCNEIAIETGEIARIELKLTIGNLGLAGDLSLNRQLSLELFKLQRGHQAAKIGASVDMTPALPQGRYRNISDYYSVQNTFPSNYAIGAESLVNDSSSYRVAQSRQLKGYLMVFDQLLANQFAQLAHVSELFSFKEQSTIAPKQDRAYDGIPYQLFSPTYFCQPLYQIPDVKPLLLGHDSYRFNIKPSNSREEEEKIWQLYQDDPFNQYIQGLRQNMESDAQRDDRRNRMLDHLLARHGEPAALYDEIISTARWYGSTLKTRIIIKNILLQNLASLSYKRTKAYSFLQAEKLGTPGRYRLSGEGFHLLADFGIAHSSVVPFVNLGCASDRYLLDTIYKYSDLRSLQAGWDADKIKDFEQKCLVIKDGNALLPSSEYHTICDGQLDLGKLEKLEQLQAQDFDNFSTVELQINLLLGLRQHYQLLVWLLLTLINSDAFKDWLKNPDSENPFILPDSDITVAVNRNQGDGKDEDHILFSGQLLLQIKNVDPKTSMLACYQAHLEQIQWLATQRKGFLLIETLLLLEPGELKQADAASASLFLNTLLVFPDYVTLFGPASFKQNLEKLARMYWPVHIANNVVAASFATLQSAIPAFIKWHNGLRQAGGMATPQMDSAATGQPTPAKILAGLLPSKPMEQS